MVKIEVIALVPGEAEEITSASTFLPLGLGELVFNSSEAVQGNTQLFFASLASYRAFSRSHQPSPTLYLHPEHSILELAPGCALPQSFYSYHLRALVLEGDPLLQFPIDLSICSILSNIAAYFTARQPKDVLVTSDSNLIIALLMQDEDAWQIYHPEYNAQNLGLDLWGTAKIIPSFLSTLRGLNSKVDLENNPYALVARGLSRTPVFGAYSFFALHYDDYMAHVDYDLWISRLLSWYKIYAKNSLHKILELACGTANIASKLVFQGYQVDACDLSYDMLNVAARKPLKPNLYHASLTDPIPQQDYDLILCMFDSINYLTNSEQIGIMLCEVYQALKIGGLFIFDISTLYNSEENFADICSLQSSQSGYLVHQAWFETTQLKQKSALHYFKRSPLGYTHVTEQHTQRVYYTKDLVQFIAKTPLKLLAIHSTESRQNFYPRHLANLDDQYPRLFFILQK